MKPAWVLVPCLLVTACAGEEEQSPAELALESDDDDTGLEEDLPGASYERPCGDKTVARVHVASGNMIAFCALDVAKGAFVEVGPHEGRPFFEEIGLKDLGRLCLLDLYMASTETQPLPRELLDTCPVELRTRDDYDRREVVSGGYFEEERAPRSHLCGAASTFESICFQCDPYDDCFDWCVSTPWGWHSRTMSGSAFLGEEGNIAFERIAACGGGSTRARGWDRTDAGDAWGPPDIDYWVSSGTNSSHGFVYHSPWWGEDFDFKLRGDTVSGAWHRHSGFFLDE